MAEAQVWPFPGMVSGLPPSVKPANACWLEEPVLLVPLIVPQDVEVV